MKTLSAGAIATLAAGSASPAPVQAGEKLAALRKTSPRNILLYSGWATTNIGDIGHTPGTLRYFSDFLPESKITCWLRKSNEIVVGMLRKRFPNVTFIENASLDNQGNSKSPELQAAFDGCDLFVQNSGMHFNRYWQPPVGLIHACVAKNKPFGLYGQSFDGFRPQDTETLPKLLSKASFIFTRDTASLEFLRKNGVTPGVLEFGPDGCFGIDVRDDAKAQAFMSAHNLEPRKFIAVIVRSDSRELLNPNDAEAVARTQVKIEAWFTKYVEVVTQVARTTDLKIALVPEVEKEIPVAKARVLEKLPEDVRSKVIWRDTWWNSDEAVSLFAQAHALVALEPHSCIMALAQGTPAIHYASLAHGTKALMFRDIGLSEWLIDVDEEQPATTLKALTLIRNDYELAQAKVKRAMEFVNRRSAEMALEVGRAKI